MDKKELLKLYDKNLDELIEISSKITRINFKNEVEACSIISAKTGNCSENCKYCSQSSLSSAKIKCHQLLSKEEIIEAAKKAKENGATRFCIVTSGRSISDEDFPQILNMIKSVSSIKGLHCCASLGLLTKKQVKQIKEAGVERYNHNINTSENYYKKICTTHKFSDRINMIKNLTEENIEACSGVILGMGETRSDRIDMIMTLINLNPKTVPINILNPIKGTPLENSKNLISEEEILKTICIFRIALPNTILRYAGGRSTEFSISAQKIGLKAGINGILLGNYLTTKGQEKSKDFKILEEMNLTLEK